MAIGNDNKARLVPLGSDGTSFTGDPIPVHFNPEKYSTGLTMTWALVGDGLQWTKTTPANLVLTLHYDTYEERTDVTTLTGKLRSQLDPGQSSAQTVGCLFQWGKMTYPGVVESITENFTLFLADGTPVRSVLTVTLRPWPQVS